MLFTIIYLAQNYNIILSKKYLSTHFVQFIIRLKFYINVAVVQLYIILEDDRCAEKNKISDVSEEKSYYYIDKIMKVVLIKS